jgi:hypothetical protein
VKITLMNKNTPLMSLDIDIKTSYVKEILKIHNAEPMPISVYSDDETTLGENFTQWWNGRSIPASRRQLRERLQELHVSAMAEIINKSFGLSLSDQYWIKPLHADIAWKDINFFTNAFSTDMGEFLIDNRFNGDLDMNSPDNTSDGLIQKKWIIEDGVRYLMKTGTPPFVQEPFNEVIGSLVLACMSVPYVEYTLAEDDHRYYSRCRNFIDENHEYVSAYYLCKSLCFEEGTPKEERLRRAMEHYRIHDGEKFVQQMLCLDFLIMNVDRHWGNFGFIRNVSTLEIECPAPIFDNGNSLWYDMAHIPKRFDKAKTFRNKHRTQIKLVRDFSGIDFSALKAVSTRAKEILDGNKNLQGGRSEEIAQSIHERIHMLEKVRDQ